MARTTRSTGTAATRRGTRPRPQSAPTGGAPATPQPGILIVNMIPEAFSFETNNDSEPNLAVNPVNPLQMAASAFTPASSGTAPIFVSSDGGQTWLLNAIVPSDRMTADITLRFADRSNMLYAGIIPQPFKQFDADGNPIPSLNILRTNNFLGPAKMQILVDRTGAGVDQPYIQAASVGAGAAASRDLVVVGANDFSDPAGQTAVIDVCPEAAAGTAAFRTVRVDSRAPPPGGADAPSIRPAIHQDGTVYGAFLALVGGTNSSNLRRDVVVVRDDDFASGASLWLPKIASGLAQLPRWATLIGGMIDLLRLLGGLLVGVFRSHAAREAEMAFLRQQLVVLQRSAPARLRLRSADRVIFVWLYRLFPSDRSRKQTAAVQPQPRELVFMPLSRRWPRPLGSPRG